MKKKDEKILREGLAFYQRSSPSEEGGKLIVDATEILRQLDAMKEEVWRLGARVQYLEEIAGIKK